MRQQGKKYVGEGIELPNRQKLNGIDNSNHVKGEVREALNKVFGFTEDHIYSSDEDEADLTDPRPLCF